MKYFYPIVTLLIMTGCNQPKPINSRQGNIDSIANPKVSLDSLTRPDTLMSFLLDSVKVAQAKELFEIDGESISTITASIVDSILNANKINYSSSGLAITSDGEVKFYGIICDYCGAYCSQSYLTFIYNKNNQPIYSEYPLKGIHTAYKLVGHRYLIIQSYTERYSASQFESNDLISVAEIKNDSLRILKIFPESRYQEGSSFVIVHPYDDRTEIIYDPTSKEIIYRQYQENTGGFIYGKYQYKENKFVLLEEGEDNPSFSGEQK